MLLCPNTDTVVTYIPFITSNEPFDQLQKSSTDFDASQTLLFQNCNMYCVWKYTDQTFHLQNIIQQITEETIENWNRETSRATIESFEQKKDCLVIIRIGKWGRCIFTALASYVIPLASLCSGVGWERSEDQLQVLPVYIFT